MWYGGKEHLSPEHILARHEDPTYVPPYYREDLTERRWRKNEQKNKGARKFLDQRAKEQQEMVLMQKQETIRLVGLILSGVGRKMQENFENGVANLCQALTLVKEKKAKAQEILEKNRLNLRTQSAIKNTKQGFAALAISQLKPGKMDTIRSQFLMIHLLDLQVKIKKEKRKGVRKSMEKLIENYKKELQRRGISTEKADLEAFAYGLMGDEKDQGTF